MSVHSIRKCNTSVLHVYESEKATVTRHRVAFKLRCLIFVSIVVVFYLRYNVTFKDKPFVSETNAVVSTRHLLSTEQSNVEQKHVQSLEPNCTRPAILDFPWDGLTRAQRQHGWILLHMCIAIYLFWLLAVVCDDYFVPAIEQLCADLRYPPDVVGATFMAIATASPELFMNGIGTFVTHGDIGLGTIVGSAVFNVLAVPAFCGIFVMQCVRLDWWSLTRDSAIYAVTVIALLLTLLDGRIMWYEALSLLLGYFFYLWFMLNSEHLQKYITRLVWRFKQRRATFREVTELTPLMAKDTKRSNNNMHAQLECGHVNVPNNDNVDAIVCVNAATPCQSAVDVHGLMYLLHILRWPITCILWLTVPDSRRMPRIKYLTLSMCIFWIGVVSYLVAYAMTIIGDTLNIPDSVMGLTILAAGMSVPEAVSSVLVTRQGRASMGISNSLGSNTFDILFCLGLPWFIKAYFLPDNVDEPWITINSGDEIIYATVFLLTSLLGLFVAIVVNRFVLSWQVGVACLLMYGGFLLVALPIEMNVFAPERTIETCKIL